MVEDSRAAAVFARLTDRIEAQDPQAALGWVTTQYEELTNTCAAPATTSAPDAAAPDATEAPATGNCSARRHAAVPRAGRRDGA